MSVDNSRVVEKALFLWKSEHFRALVRPQTGHLMRPLMAALLRGGQPFWNPTVNKMAAHVLETLEELDPDAFRAAAEDLWGKGRTPEPLPEPVAPAPLPGSGAPQPQRPRNAVPSSLGGGGGGIVAWNMQKACGAAGGPGLPGASDTATAAVGTEAAGAGPARSHLHANSTTPITPAPWATGAPLVSVNASMGRWHPGRHINGGGGVNGVGGASSDGSHGSGTRSGRSGPAMQPPLTITGVAPWAFKSGGAGGAGGAARRTLIGGPRTGSGGSSGSSGGGGGGGIIGAGRASQRVSPPLKRPLPPPASQSPREADSEGRYRMDEGEEGEEGEEEAQEEQPGGRWSGGG
ncbi:unnamed protein product, partial [Phaeothamnion confervicola]